jgi:hypothetical protein
MSYSFVVRADTKTAVLEKIAAQFDTVVAQQPIHAADRAQAQATAEAFLEIIPSKADDQDFYVSVGGSVGWRDDNVITSASVNISAYLVPKEAMPDNAANQL